MRCVVIALLIAGCSAHVAPMFPDCPPDVSAPPPIPRKHTPLQVAKLEIGVELWGEQERDRGDACAAAVEARDQWIRGH